MLSQERTPEGYKTWNVRKGMMMMKIGSWKGTARLCLSMGLNGMCAVSVGAFITGSRFASLQDGCHLAATLT